MASIARCMQEFLRVQPRAASRACWNYLESVPVQPIHRLPSPEHLNKVPFWIAFPVALERRGGARVFRDDILWAQYCVYLSERIRDDLFDGHTMDQRLAEIPGMLDQRAEETFSRHFGPRSSFWHIYRTFRKATTDAIRNVDQLQARQLDDPAKLLVGYSRIASVFKLGTLAMCLRQGMVSDVQVLQRIADDIAVGSQIIDDVADIVDDLKRRRYNYAVQMILSSARRRRIPRDSIPNEVLKGLLHPDAIEGVLDEALKRFTRARTRLQRHRFFRLAAIPFANEMAIQRMKEDIRRRRIEFLFNKFQAGLSGSA